MKIISETEIETSWMSTLSHPNLSGLSLHDLLELLYKLQCKRLEEISAKLSNMDSGMIHMLGKAKNRVVGMAGKAYRSDRFPFVPVIPRGNLITFYDIIQASSSEGDQWIQSMGLKWLNDLPAYKSHHIFPYIIFSINPGEDTLGMCPRDGREKIKTRNGTPLSFAQGLAVRAHMEMFKTRPFYACASTFDGKESVPGFQNSPDGTMSRTDSDRARPGWVCPSFGSSTAAISWHGVISPKSYISPPAKK